MVKEFGLAVEMRLDSRIYDGDDDHLVMADEIARAIRCVMDGDNEVRKKVKEMSVIARKSTLEEMRLDSSREDDGDHIVVADEIARAVRCVMEDDSEIRKKVKEMSEIARKSMLHGGSSFDSIRKFIDLNF
ncbi:hypothetical protein LWI29_006891 [Acer saccharum]|uniref:UDP-glycosyltransferase n=1 Tax=Acer saccharum TaxID=4024 RepID=A0AA39T819_ACESA|nr:hypothetical protein LWI29_006891 [Acer saccharum]